MPETKIEHKFVPGPIANEKLKNQKKAQSANTLMYAVLAIVVLLGGYYLYTSEVPSAAVTSTITKTDMAPVANAPATSTTVVPATPMAATPPATATPAAPLAAAPPASGTAPAPAATTPKP
ncbi:MAG: hypothetical protein ABI230_06985 [Aestuariivirga sp.]